jgi:hypothetical protein
MTTTAKLKLAMIALIATSLGATFSRPLGLTGVAHWLAPIGVLVLAGFVFHFSKRLKEERSRDASAGGSLPARTTDRWSRARRRLLAMWALGVAVALSTPLWEPFAGGIRLGLRSDIIVSVVGVLIISAVFGFLIKRLPNQAAFRAPGESGRP